MHDFFSLIDPVKALLKVGVATLALVPAGVVWALLDRRRIGRERVAIKPTKFALSIAVYLLTVSWMLGYARPDRLSSAFVQLSVWGLLLGATVELACITLQAARGRRSHFNTGSALDAAIAGTMAVLAILFIGMLLPLAWEIAQRPRPDAPALMIAGIVGGLALTFILGGLTGSAMGRPIARAAGTGIRRALPEAQRQSRLQAQVAHFLGIHAMQAVPVMAWGSLATGGPASASLLTGSVVLYLGATLLLLYRPVVLPAWPDPAALHAVNRS